MKVNLERKNDKFLFEAKGNSGVPVYIDNKTDEASKGASPMELLLIGVGGCSAIDVISILKKQRQEITSYKMEVEGQREEVRERSEEHTSELQSRPHLVCRLLLEKKKKKKNKK